MCRALPNMYPIRIGVAEDKPLDLQHPDLAGCIYGLAAAIPGAAPYAIRAARDDMTDHATMVAWIIAARRSGFDVTGLLPRALVVPLDGRENQIGDRIGDAASEGVRLFNISAHFGPDHQPQSLLDTIKANPRALFVVAAGNENQRVCEQGYRVYPACWGNEKNVLVVTATSLDGTSVLIGMNRSAAAVHVAAPGQGFYVAGFDRSYVPALGTSFATPVVTAAAARLFVNGATDPWEIKQRLIATTDPIGSGDDLQGGLLNVKRALVGIDRPGWAVLARPDAEKPEETHTGHQPLAESDNHLPAERQRAAAGAALQSAARAPSVTRRLSRHLPRLESAASAGRSTRGLERGLVLRQQRRWVPGAVGNRRRGPVQAGALDGVHRAGEVRPCGLIVARGSRSRSSRSPRFPSSRRRRRMRLTHPMSAAWRTVAT